MKGLTIYCRCASRGGASDSSQMSNVLSHDYYVAVQVKKYLILFYNFVKNYNILGGGMRA